MPYSGVTMTQRDRVLEMLSVAWVCGTEFEAEHIPGYWPRIEELRREGVHIDQRACQRHRHDSVEHEWRLLEEAWAV